MQAWLDYTINGLIVGNIYALLAVGLALIFGVSHLINFAQGSIYTTGAYIGWTCATQLHTPLPVTMAIVVAGCALLGVVIERVGLRPLAGSARIAPLLATIGISFVLDQALQLIFSPDPRAVPNPLPNWRFAVGRGTIGALDLLIAGIGIVSAAVLFGFLRFSRLGWAVRATAQDSEAARQVGVDTDAVNRIVFAIAGGLGGLSGLLVGMYYNHIDPAMSFQATLKGVVAQVIGGMGNVPGAIGGALLLGLTESYGVALFGSSYRNLFAFVLLLLMLVLRPNGLFAPRRAVPPEPLTGTFIAPSRAWSVPSWAIALAVVAAALLPLLPGIGYGLQVLTNAWLYAMLAISLTLVAGTLGQVSLGHAGLLLIGAYASALLALDSGYPVWLSIPAAGLVTAALGTALTFPAFRLRSHYVSIATLGIGEIVGLVILNWESLTRGPMGVTAVPPLSLGPLELDSPQASYWTALAVLVLLALGQQRLLGTHLGRTFRAIRDDDVAARAYGVSLDRYKGLAFGVSGFAAGISGAISAHLYSYINNETWTSQVSVLALTMVILGGMGNVLGAIIGAVALTGLPELFRFTTEYRMLIYGLVLLLMIRFRPQGLLGDGMTDALLRAEGLTRRFGGITAVDRIGLELREGELLSVIGPNGAGKTTLFNLLTGHDRPDAGQIVFAGKDVTGWSPERLAGQGMARTFQHGRVFANLSVRDNVRMGAHSRLRVARRGLPLLGALRELASAMLRPSPIRQEEAALDREVEEILSLFGDRLLPRMDQPAFSLSYANRRRVEIARALALRPRLLLLDEPTAGMNESETAEMSSIVAGLKARGQTVLLIEHKLDLVMQLSDRVIAMDDGKEIAAGTPDAVRRDPAVLEAYLGHRHLGGEQTPEAVALEGAR